MEKCSWPKYVCFSLYVLFETFFLLHKYVKSFLEVYKGMWNKVCKHLKSHLAWIHLTGS